MPRLSLYRPNKQNDYKFIDRTVAEMYQVGGLDIYVHAYLGVKDATGDSGSGDATQPTYNTENPLFIEDLLFIENRNRSYSDDVIRMRGIYQQSDIDFDLSQFGLFLASDTVFITFHYNDMIEILGRKLMAGDVLEFPNLKDYHPLDTSIGTALPKFYVIQDASFASEGFSQTWLPHLWRVKATPLVGAQEYNDILQKPASEDQNIWDNINFYPAGTIIQDGDNYYEAVLDVPPGVAITDTAYWAPYEPDTIVDILGTVNKDRYINDQLLTQAEVEVPLSGYDSTKFYIVATDKDGNTIDPSDPLAAPRANGYTVGYLTGDSQQAIDENGDPIFDQFGDPVLYDAGDTAPNGRPITADVTFPMGPSEGDYALRLDYSPNRLFRFNGSRWVKIEDGVRTNLTPGPDNKTLRSGFVNNTNTVTTSDRGEIPSRQGLSDILKPEADN